MSIVGLRVFMLHNWDVMSVATSVLNGMKTGHAHEHHYFSSHPVRQNGCQWHVVKSSAVFECLVKENISAADIYGLLRCMYGDACMDVSSVGRWVKRFKHGKHRNDPRCGRPRSATTERNKQKVESLIKQDRRVKVRELTGQLGLELHPYRRRWRPWNIGK
jgi:hypothetical protein